MATKKINKILIANRGEIALRVIKTCRKMGIATVAVFSDADKNGLFVKQADEAVHIGASAASESYLRQEKIIEAAKKTNADAIHPGYGFLSENAAFAQLCADNDLIFIGPQPNAIESMGSKIKSKEIMKAANVPVVPGYDGDDQSLKKFKTEAKKTGFPVLLKASAGGGGKGMRIVNKEGELEKAFEAAKREAKNSFGDDSLLLEKYFPSAKHIEFQVFGDTHGNYLHLFERECSVQRRYQKIIEESPSPSLDKDLRKEMGEAAVAATKAIKYTNAGTVEFILDKDKNFYFLEMNTRLQVEHPVTEEVLGLDLVRLQIEVAEGKALNIQNKRPCGHAIECRIYAEDAENNFFPDTGEVLLMEEPQNEGVRFDNSVERGSAVDVFYDPMICKVITSGEDREEARRKMLHTLSHTAIFGLTTNIEFLREILQHEKFIDGSFDTKLIETDFTAYQRKVESEHLAEAALAATLYNWLRRNPESPFDPSLNGWRNSFYQYQFEIFERKDEKLKVEYKHLNGMHFHARSGELEWEVELPAAQNNHLILLLNGHRKKFVVAQNEQKIYVLHPEAGNIALDKVPRFIDPAEKLAEGGYLAPMPGEIVKVLVKPGDKVKSGSGLVVMNSMKMESTIEAHSDGEVEDVMVEEKSFVEADTVLVKMKE